MTPFCIGFQLQVTEVVTGILRQPAIIFLLLRKVALPATFALAVISVVVRNVVGFRATTNPTMVVARGKVIELELELYAELPIEFVALTLKV
jgi:hypothetical protein